MAQTIGHFSTDQAFTMQKAQSRKGGLKEAGE